MTANDLMNEGLNFLNKGNYNDALDKFNKALDVDPNLTEYNYYKGVTQQLLSQFDNALESFNKELSLNPNHINSLISKGTTLCILDRKEDGIAEFDKALEIEPNNIQALNNKSIALQQLNKYDESIECLDKSIEADNSNYVSHLSKGNLKAAQEKYKEAIECYKNATEKNPNSAQAFYNMGVCYINLKQYDEAKNCFEDALKIIPDLYEALIGKATIEYEKKNYQEAINLFDEILKKYPCNDNILFKKGICQEELEKIEEAVKTFDEALKINPNNIECLYQKGSCLDTLNKKDEAISCYDKIIEDNNNKFLEDTHLLKGKILLDQEKFEEANKEFDEVIKLNPNSASAYFYKGYINATGDPRDGKEAIKNFSQCINIDSSDKLFYYNLGIALLDEQYLEQCKGYLYKAYELDNTFYKPLLKIGEVYLKIGKYDEALAYFDLILKNEPDNEAALVRKGDTYLMKNNISEAMNLYESVLKLNEKNEDALLGMGICCHKMNKEDEAMDYYEKVLQVNDENPNALYNKAILLSNKGEHKSSNDLLKKAKNLDDSPYILYAYGLNNLRDKKYDLALENFNSCIEKNFNNPEIFHAEAQALYGNGEYEKADQFVDQAINAKNNYFNAWNTKANILDKMGKKIDALSWYKSAGESKPENALYLTNCCVSLLENEYPDESKKLLTYIESIYQSQKNLFSEQEYDFIENTIKNLNDKFNNVNKNAKIIKLPPTENNSGN